jgi:hypothetical protein
VKKQWIVGTALLMLMTGNVWADGEPPTENILKDQFKKQYHGILKLDVISLKNLDAKGNQATWSAEGDVSSSDDLYTWVGQLADYELLEQTWTKDKPVKFSAMLTSKGTPASGWSVNFYSFQAAASDRGRVVDDIKTNNKYLIVNSEDFNYRFSQLESALNNQKNSIPALEKEVKALDKQMVVSLSGFELSHMQLYIGAALSAILVLFTLTLPHIPVAKQQANQSWTTLLGLDAFALFKNKRMAIFFIFSMLLGAELQITNMFGNTFLHSFDKDPMFASSFIVQHASIIMSISQISETLFILTIPFFLSRYGIKNVMMISIVAWILRFALFAYGDPTPFGTVLLVLSMIVYGCAFDFFNISGSVFVEKEVSPAIRASAQGMFLMMTNGFGCILGGIVSGKVVEMYTQNGITDWQTVWLIFAGYSVVLAFAFMAMFKYKHVRVPTGTQTVSH